MLDHMNNEATPHYTLHTGVGVLLRASAARAASRLASLLGACLFSSRFQAWLASQLASLGPHLGSAGSRSSLGSLLRLQICLASRSGSVSLAS